MSTLIIYDSLYGNTEKIANAIGDSISGGSKVLRVEKAGSLEFGKFDLLIVGSPTQAGSPTKTMQDFLSGIPDKDIKNIDVTAFDTRMSGKGHNLFVGIVVNFFGYAAEKILNSLRKKGCRIRAAPQGFIVESKEGPLKDGELARAAEWAKSLSKK
jgi:flavodoxin I